MTAKRIREINENFYRVHKAIPLTRGMMTFIDECDYELLSQFKWHFVAIRGHGIGYAVRAVYYAPKKKITLPMHNAIVHPPEGMEVDHIDGNGLNNHRANLRICTHAENLRNQALSRRSTTGVRGVVLHISRRYYAARIMVNQKQIHLGYFPTLGEARNARLEAEIKYFGEYRRNHLQNIS